MDLMLMSVTGFSLALAAVMGVLLFQVLREERRRSDARVALLTDLAAEPVTHAGSARIAHEGELFHVEAEPSPWPRRFAVIGIMAATLALGLFAVKSTTATTTPGKAAAAPAAAAAARPLELLSLKHAQEEGTLTVSGLVQNPRGSAQVNGAEATVLVFDASGVMLTSGRAPLDFTTLGSGDESPFVIKVPVQGAVARYRIGFRGADGRVLGHVDRRNAESIAQRQEP